LLCLTRRPLHGTTSAQDDNECEPTIRVARDARAAQLDPMVALRVS